MAISRRNSMNSSGADASVRARSDIFPCRQAPLLHQLIRRHSVRVMAGALGKPRDRTVIAERHADLLRKCCTSVFHH